jgi:glycosyltransferase involved in cell wall biosynthesis
MKILQFGRFYRREFGGIERHVELLMQGLSATVEVDNVAAYPDGGREVLHVNGGRVFTAPSYGIIASIPIAPQYPLLVRDLCREGQYDILHLHFPDPFSQFVVQAAHATAKIVVTWHSDIVRQRALLKLYRPFVDRFLRRADAIVAATPAHFSTSEQIPRDIDKHRLHVIPYGMQAARYGATPDNQAKAARVRERYGAGKLVFTVGRHVYYKGFEYLIRAMQQVDGTLLLGGSGPLQQELSRLVRALGLTQKVILVGRIPDEELPAYYLACDVFCMPSVERSEAFGLVQLEAMAAGRPVVCCQLGNGVNYVNRDGETGLAVPPRDVAALASALNALLRDDGLRARMGLAGQARVQDEFTVAKMAQRHLDLYRSLLQGR